LILGDDKNDIEQALYIFDWFSVCAGLRVNLDKTKAIWNGSRLCSDKQLLPEKHLAWNTSGKFKLLGIHFNFYKEDKTLENFGEKIKKVKNSLSSWAYRDLTYFGRITAMKTLSNLCRLSLYYQTLLFKF
jgi:hypothetical protein